MMEGKDGQTEKATAKRRQDERNKGRLPLSQEVMSVVAILTGTLLMRAGFPSYLAGTRRMMEFSAHAMAPGPEWTGAWLQQVYWHGFSGILIVLAPLLGCLLLAGIVGCMGQTGPYFSWGAFQAGGLKALNPVKGAKNLFSLKSFTKLGMTLLKIAVIAGVVVLCWRRHWQTVPQLPAFGLTASIAWIGRRFFYTVLLVALVAIVIAALDVVIVRYRNEKAMMMTKQEVKDERKQHEIKPEVKKAQFKKMRSLTLARLVSSVPDSTVVITNPTHVAVALKYDPAHMDAPEVIAKGLRLRARRIRELAEKHGIPIIERPVLARSLYRSVPLGRAIPAALFEGVAEVLAYLHRLGHRWEGVHAARGDHVA